MENIRKLKEIYGLVPEKDKEIIADFFITFSFFEFGIKEYGFSDKRKSYPSSDWNAYIKEIEKSFNPDHSPELHEAVKFFRENPLESRYFEKTDR